MTTISIAMATFNGAAFLQEQLDSLANQSRLPQELVISDDGSTDATIEIIERFALSAPFPVYLHRNAARLGYSANFLKCASICQGTYVAFCDQDDVWETRKLSVVSDILDDETTIVFHNAVIFRYAREGELLYPKNVFTDTGALHPFLNLFGFTVTFHKSLLQFERLRARSIDFNNGTRIEAHDQWISFIGSCLGRVRYIDESLVKYRQHERNVFGAQKSTLEQRVSNLMSAPSRQAFLNECTKRRVAILSELSAEATSKQAVWLEAAQDRYKSAQYLQFRRCEIYTSSSFMARLRAFIYCARQLIHLKHLNANISRLGIAQDLLFSVNPHMISCLAALFLSALRLRKGTGGLARKSQG